MSKTKVAKVMNVEAVAWPFPTSRPVEPTIDFKQFKEKSLRKEFMLTEEQYEDLVEASHHVGTDDTKLHLFWAQVGDKQNFKWWTVSPDRDRWRVFTAEVLNEKD